MNSTSMDTALKEAGILIQNDKATQQMQQSISKFASLLTCPLCDKIFNRPATLSACGHTFCTNCIDAYSSNHSICPVEGCGMPLSIVGGNGGSFRKPNLQIAQTLESLQLIVKSLNRSDNNWWQSPDTLQLIREMKGSRDEDTRDDNSESLEMNNEDNSDEEEMIDLQADQDDQSCLSLGEDKDEQGTDGNLSDSESLS